MGGFKGKTRIKDKGFNNLIKSLDAARAKEVLIGIPEADASRAGSGINNAELAYIHEHGSAMHNIPPRPFLQVSINANIQKILAEQSKMLKAVIEQGPSQVEPGLERIGLLGQSIVKGWFTDSRNNWAPNKPATIAAKGSDKPLIDTGTLRNSITYVVRDKP